MQKIDISYNPYKMETILSVNGTNVCDSDDYTQFKEFIETDTPLQTWAEPIPYKNWQGVINELSSDDCFDKLVINFSGRKIDFEDLKRACDSENEKRACKLEIEYNLISELNDEKLAQNIEVVMQTLLSDKFAELVKECGAESQIAKDYADLAEDYQLAKNKEFKIVFAGLYSSGKSTILNSLVHRNILPTSDETCTSKTCRLKHDKSLKGKISLECFDVNGVTVVDKKVFDTDEECLEKFWEITPLGAKKSNPETVETIEICLDLSHLYPSKEMEKEFNLVIVDTPGCNSSKTKGVEKGIKQDIRIALDAITNGDKEMVVICADAQDYEDESLGEFLKAINESAEDEDDRGDFNDRFLFVLNKCDTLKYNEKESVTAKKENFAKYLMDTKRWGITEKENSPKFVPKIFMVCAYISFAVHAGVANFTDEELDSDINKQNLQDEYDDYWKKVIKRKNKNYYLASVCDIPEYRKVELQQIFEDKLDNDCEDEAISVQSGMECIEIAIRDYIARYAYPFKVRDLMNTFDSLLYALNSLNEFEDKKLKKRLEEMGKDISEREEVKREKEDQEEKERKLNLLNEKVNKQKDKISAIFFDEKKMRKIREDMEVYVESQADVERVRNINNKFTKVEINQLVESIDTIFSQAYFTATERFNALTNEYKQKLETICAELRAISKELENGEIYDFSGYSFADSLGVKKIHKMDVKSLREQVESTKKTVKEGRYISVRNPIKDEQYKWWQFGKKIKRAFASETISKYIEEEKDVYNAEPLQKYLENTLGEFAELCFDTAKNYSNDINIMKQQALQMATDIPKDIESTSERITQFINRINACGDNIAALEEQMKAIKEKKGFLEGLINVIRIGGQYV